MELNHPYAVLACDLCGATVVGDSASAGLYFSVRGEDVRWEQPPVCPSCSAAIGITVATRWAEEEG